MAIAETVATVVVTVVEAATIEAPAKTRTALSPRQARSQSPGEATIEAAEANAEIIAAVVETVEVIGTAEVVVVTTVVMAELLMDKLQRTITTSSSSKQHNESDRLA